MIKKQFILGAGLIAVLATWCAARSALALTSDFTFGNFENFSYVSTDYPNNYNNAVTEGWINNGPTPDGVSGPDPNQDTPPVGYNAPVNFPAQAGGGTGQSFGTWAVTHNTGWTNWGQGNQQAFYSNSTTGVTNGSTSIRMNPRFFGQGQTQGNFQQNLSVKIQNMGTPVDNNPTIADDTSLAAPTNAAFYTHTYVAYDVTFVANDWTHGAFVNTGAAGSEGAAGSVNLYMWTNLGGGTSTTPLVDRFGYHPLGAYRQNTANADTGLRRAPDVDSRQALLGGSFGTYDPGNHAAGSSYTTTLYYNYAHWQSSPTSTDGGAGSGGPATGVYYDERTFGTNGIVNEDVRSAYLEFGLGSAYDNGYTAGDFYIDNFRFVTQVLRLGDFNMDGHINAADILAGEQALTNPATYEANNGGLSANDLLTVADVNGDHKFNGSDIQSLINDLKAGLGSAGAVPEPASIALLGLALPALMYARKRRHTA